MKIRSLETFKITLPFRFSFGHSLATRAESSNLIVKVTLDNGCTGYGEGVPRDYVTGETVDSAEENVLLKYTPRIIGMSMDQANAVVKELQTAFAELGLQEKAQGASWCALELAVLDACSKLHGMAFYQLLGEKIQDRIRYGGVIPFGKKRALLAVLLFYRLYGFKTVKLKVGGDIEDDLEKLRLTRKIMGEDCVIRVDANCAWTLEQALKAAERFRVFGVQSYEQPLPPNDWQSLKTLSDSIEEDIVLDESLCTISQARDLASQKICDAFNVRVSKAGGVLAAQEMIRIAQENGLRVHLGAQVGESGILSAAARHLALLNQALENYEGSANAFLLKKDICRENLTAGLGGFGDLNYARKNKGLGLTISEDNLLSMTTSTQDPVSDVQAPNGMISRQAR